MVEDHRGVEAAGLAVLKDRLAIADPVSVDQVAAGDQLHVYGPCWLLAPRRLHSKAGSKTHRYPSSGPPVAVHEDGVKLAAVIVVVVTQQERPVGGQALLPSSSSRGSGASVSNGCVDSVKGAPPWLGSEVQTATRRQRQRLWST